MTRCIKFLLLTLPLLVLLTVSPAAAQGFGGPDDGDAGDGGSGSAGQIGSRSGWFTFPAPPPYPASSSPVFLPAVINNQSCGASCSIWTVHKTFGPQWIHGSGGFGQSLYLWWHVPPGTAAGSYLAQFTVTGCSTLCGCTSFTIPIRVVVP